METKNKVDTDGNEMIQCARCGKWLHTLAVHLGSAHKMNTADYRKMYPGKPTTSRFFQTRLSVTHTKSRRASRPTTSAPRPVPPRAAVTHPLPEPEPLVKGEEEEIKSSPTREESDPIPPPPPGSLAFGRAVLKMRDDLTAEDGLYVPQHDDNFALDERALFDIAMGVEMDTNVLLVGPTGCGKTSHLFELASLIAQPVKRINMNGEFRVADFVGEKVLVETDSGASVVAWKDGALTECARKGWWLLVDELDAAPARILLRLQSVLESGHPLILAENNGEVVKVHPSFRIVATANTLGRGDESGLYAGTNALNEATLDRFGMVLEFGYLPRDEEVSVVVNKTRMSRTQAAAMVSVAQMVRDGLTREECYCTLSTRRLITWGHFAKRMENVRQAAVVAVLNRLNKDDRAYVKGIIDRQFS